MARWIGRAVAASFALALASLPARAEQIPVRVGVIPVIGVSQIFVVHGEGWAKQAGMDLKFTTFESGPNMIQALASGTIDVYVGGVMPLTVARSRGIESRVVAATAIEEMVFVAGPKLAPYFANGASTADAFKAFREKEGRKARLAAQPPGSVPDTTLQHWLWPVSKVSKSDVEVTPMGIDATQQAVLAGAVDGAAIREPALTIVQKRNPAIKLIATGGQMFPSQPGSVMAVSGSFLEKHPDAVQKLVDGVVKATEELKTDPARVAPFVEAALGKGIIDVATITQALRSPASRFISDPMAIVDATAKMQAFQVSIGTLDKEAPLDGLFDPRFYANAVKR